MQKENEFDTLEGLEHPRHDREILWNNADSRMDHVYDQLGVSANGSIHHCGALLLVDTCARRFIIDTLK
jgi:hypothetical protein